MTASRSSHKGLRLRREAARGASGGGLASYCLSSARMPMLRAVDRHDRYNTRGGT